MSEVINTLREAVSRWESEKKTRSLSMLARLSQVSYSTVRRMMQGETVSPSIENCLSIAEVVMTVREQSKFANQLHPTLEKNRTNLSYPVDEDLSEFLDDEGFFPALLLSSHKNGTDEDEVRYYFGQEVARNFKKLVDLGHLSRCGKRWKLDKDIGTVKLGVGRSLLSILAKISPSENDSIPDSSVAHVGWESVDDKTAVALFHLSISFARESVELISNKDNRGDNLVFFGTLFNVLKRGEGN